MQFLNGTSDGVENHLSGIFLEKGTATEFSETELGERIVIGGKLLVLTVEGEADDTRNTGIEPAVFLVLRIVILLLGLLVQVLETHIKEHRQGRPYLPVLTTC